MHNVCPDDYVMSIRLTVCANASCVSYSQSIVIDDEDEEGALDAPAINHAGPVEGKVLLGTDNRLYALEMIRLTPRDANYVKVSGREEMSI